MAKFKPCISIQQSGKNHFVQPLRTQGTIVGIFARVETPENAVAYNSQGHIQSSRRLGFSCLPLFPWF
ncbi:hypothetical protein H9642_08470 [Pseudomonadaceae bacterium Sa2CUA2]|uniref:Uncharacterized protein n=1 Tax=Serpens gallinarum TaxID=2763075 RepID=A0ABR8TNK6_9PSED|nr:hypothetical protein [Serpens gallinarum]